MKIFYTTLVLSCLSCAALASPEMARPAFTPKPAVTIDAETIAAIKADGDKSNKKLPQSKPTTTAQTDTAKLNISKAVAAKTPGVLGDMQIYRAKYEDTLVSIAEKFNLGYVELRAANPGVDAWLPGAGTKIVIPTRHLLPDGPRNGIVVNLGEMRLYNYIKDHNNPETFPIGVGREGFSTPVGSTSVMRKAKDPIWRPTERMLKEVPDLDPVVGPGPENPLGDRAMYLGWPTYLIHGTNKPWGVGRRVSSGCVRMFPDDVRKLFDETPVGTKVTVIRQSTKIGWIGDMLYVEIAPEGAQADFVENRGERAPYSVPADLFSRLKKAAGKQVDNIDWEAVRQAAIDRYGFPVPVLKGWKKDEFMKAAGMTRPPQVSLTISEEDMDAAIDRHTSAQLALAEQRASAHDDGVEQDVAPKKSVTKRYAPKKCANGGYNC